MPPNRAERGRPRDPELDTLILETTRAQLAIAGYARMTVDAVAKAAGVTRPTVYLRWPSKEELVVAAIQDLERPEMVKPSGDTYGDLKSILHAVKASFIDHDNASLMGPILTERKHSPRLFEEFHSRLSTPRRSSIRAVLEDGISSGTLRADLPVDATVSAVVGSFYAKIMAAEPIGDDFPDQVLDLLWAGMVAAKRKPAAKDGHRTSRTVSPVSAESSR